MRVHLKVIAAIAAMIPVVANGAEISWLKFCRAGSTVTSITPGTWACMLPLASGDHSTVLSVGSCENFDILITPDANGDTVTGTALTYSMKHCPSTNDSLDTMAKRDAACVEYNPGGAVTGSGETLGAGGVYFYVKTGGTHAGDPQLTVRCSQPSTR